MNCGSRIYNEQGIRRFWDGNFTNCIRYFPTQAFNLAFKDTFKKMFPKYNPKTEFMQFFGANLVSGGMAAAGSLCIVYPEAAKMKPPFSPLSPSPPNAIKQRFP